MTTATASIPIAESKAAPSSSRISKESQKNRAIASYQRGLGYERKGEFGAAIADFNEAIKLKIEGDSASKRRDYVSKKKEAIDRATPTLGSLDGTWEGALQSVNKDGTPAKPGSYRIVINGADAKVFILADGKDQEVKPTAISGSTSSDKRRCPGH